MSAEHGGELLSVFLFLSLPYFEGERRNLSLNVELAVLAVLASKSWCPSVNTSPMPALPPQSVLPHVLLLQVCWGSEFRYSA